MKTNKNKCIWATTALDSVQLTQCMSVYNKFSRKKQLLNTMIVIDLIKKPFLINKKCYQKINLRAQLPSKSSEMN